METKNLDKLMEQATNADRRTYEGARIRTRFARLFATHGPAMVTVLKSNLEVLKGCEFAMNTFLPDSKFVAQEGLNRIQPAIKEIETLLMKLDQEAT